MRLSDQDRQGGTVVPRCLTSLLSQDQLPLYIDHGEPLQPMFPGALLLAEVLYTADEITAHRALRQPGGIDGYRGRTSPPPGHAAYDLVHHPRHIGRIKPDQKAIQRGVIGNGVQMQGGSQFRVLPQSNLSLTKGPILVAHQAKHSQQLRLRKLPLAELGPLRGQNCPADFERQPSKSHQSNFGHNGMRKRQNSFSLTRFCRVPHCRRIEDVNRAKHALGKMEPQSSYT